MASKHLGAVALPARRVRASVALPSFWTTGRIAICVVAVGLTGLWMQLDSVPPSYDQSHYLDITLHYLRGFSADGLGGLHDAMVSPLNDPGRAPLYSLLMVPFFAAFGASVNSGLALNLVLWPVLLLSVAEIGRILFDRRVGLLAMFLTGAIPLLIGLSHEALQDFLLATLATLAILLLLLSRGFERTAVSACVGFVIGLGWLTKVTFPVLIAGPLVLCLFSGSRVFRSEEGHSDTGGLALRRLRNVAIAAAISLAMAGSWYVENWGPTLDYIDYSTTGEGTLGLQRPLLNFTLDGVNRDLSWVVALGALVAGSAVLVQWVRRWRGRGLSIAGPAFYRGVFLASWILVPYFVIGFSRNPEFRYMAGSMPAIAVLTAGLVMSIRHRLLRTSVLAVLCGACAFQVTALTTRVRIPGLPDQVSVGTPIGDAVLPLSSQSIGFARRPLREDHTTPILDYIESRSRSGSGLQPRVIGVLQPHRSINPNTLNWLADVRDDPFTFVDERAGPGLRERLLQRDFIVYIEPPPWAIRGRSRDRHTLLTQRSASAVMNDELFALFQASQKSFAVPDLEAGVRDLKASEAPRVQVLQRSSP
jgi:4-amino-4-deoxy-L-arabinose transferase-like glycosyltransferase